MLRASVALRTALSPWDGHNPQRHARGSSCPGTLLEAGAGGEVKAAQLAGDALEVARSIGMDDSAVLLFALGRISESDTRLSFSGRRTIAGRLKAWLPGR